MKHSYRGTHNPAKTKLQYIFFVLMKTLPSFHLFRPYFPFLSHSLSLFSCCIALRESTHLGINFFFGTLFILSLCVCCSVIDRSSPANTACDFMLLLYKYIYITIWLQIVI